MVISLSRRRIVLGMVCAGLALLPAIGGWTAGRSLRPAAAPAPTASTAAGTDVYSVASPLPIGAPAGPAPSVLPSGTAAPLPGASAPPPSRKGGGPDGTGGLGAPVGWKLSDIPAFGPALPPEPIVLPPGDQVPYLSRVPVTQPVAFLTIDDGFLKNPEAPKLFAAAGVPITLFLTTGAIQDDVPFFDRLRNYGAVIEAHTITHPELAGRSYAYQHRQICTGADQLEQWYGRRPVLFRPPFGDKDATTLRVSKECGIKAAFMWKETVDKGIVRYQEGTGVQPGDIILMHFRPAFVKDFIAALRAIHQAGLTPALLEDYIPGERPVPAPREPGTQD